MRRLLTTAVILLALLPWLAAPAGGAEDAIHWNRPRPEAQPGQGAGGNCRVTGIRMLFPAVGGFDISPVDDNVIVYVKPDKKDVQQVHVHNLVTGEDYAGLVVGRPSPRLGG